ncbi:MAG: hypothetical protein AAGG48_25635 [Planctomycetota bacterium]
MMDANPYRPIENPYGRRQSMFKVGLSFATILLAPFLFLYMSMVVGMYVYMLYVRVLPIDQVLLNVFFSGLSLVAIGYVFVRAIRFLMKTLRGSELGCKADLEEGRRYDR